MDLDPEVGLVQPHAEAQHFRACQVVFPGRPPVHGPVVPDAQVPTEVIEGPVEVRTGPVAVKDDDPARHGTVLSSRMRISRAKFWACGPCRS